MLAPVRGLLRGRRAADARRWTWCSSARTERPSPSSRSRAATRRSREGDLVLPSLEIAGPGGHWVEVSRAIAAGGQPRAPRRGGCSRPTRSTTRPRARRCVPAHRARRPPRRLEGLQRPRLRARPRHRPLDRDDDDRVPEDRRGGRDRARRRTWSSRCTRTRSPPTAMRASTCRTPGSSPRTAASRWPACRCGSSTALTLGRTTELDHDPDDCTSRGFPKRSPRRSSGFHSMNSWKLSDSGPSAIASSDLPRPGGNSGCAPSPAPPGL